MNTFCEFGNKNFKSATNLIFLLALVIIILQVFQNGLSHTEKDAFVHILKPINLVFSIMTCMMSWYLFQITQLIVIKIARFVFLVISVIYLLMSIFWTFNVLHSVFDIESYRMFLSFFIAFIAISFKVASLGNTNIHPALLFVLSFIFLILFGAFMLMLPAAANKDVTFVQALFTSTSAVTVTGLAILDTGKDFTLFGQSVIMLLLQLGGLGVLTVTNIFALVFNSSSTYRNRVMVSDMIKELDKNRTFSTLFKIIFITLLVEIIGAVLIYLSIYNVDAVTDRPIFFSLFHSVSAFCNGGFSTLSNSLYEEPVRFNYFFHTIIAWLIITGGLGYSVMINHYLQLKNFVLHKLSKINVLGVTYKKELTRTSTNSRIILITTGLLLLSGTLLFFISEYNGSLKEHDLVGKIMVSFFNSTTPRTAGFNNVNMAELGIPAIMLIMALMWIGASPGSTGGGIKTTTFAVALLNLWNQIRGKERIIVRNKEISLSAINQVNAVILLSIFAISFGTFLIAFMQSNLLFKDILFECISAYSTVGLSVGITPKLTEASHLTLIGLMFLGRVSFLTFLIGIFGMIFKDEKGTEPYYPSESVNIN